MGKFSFLGFVRDQLSATPPVDKVDLAGKTVIVVGANTGLGFEAAKHFASMGPARLILACRSEERGQSAVSKIRDTGYENPELWLLDLAEFSSVKSFADKFEKEGGRLDILVMNAGVALPDYKPTTDGWELTLQVNHISTALLSLLLLPHMIQTANEFSTTPRLVVVTSELHYIAKVEEKIMENPEKLKTYSTKEYCTPANMAVRYNLSKLLNVLFVRGLNDHITSSSITVNAVNPGFCISEFRRNLRGVQKFMSGILEKVLARTTEQGSRQLVWAALADESKNNIRGAYVSSMRIEEPSDLVLGEKGHKLQEQIWSETIGILAAVDPRIQDINEKYLTKKT